MVVACDVFMSAANKESQLGPNTYIVASISAVIIALITIRSILPLDLLYGLLILLASAILITVGFGFLKPFYDRWVEWKKVKARKLESCKSSIRMATDDYVKNDKWDYHPNVSHVEFHPESDARVRKFVDDYLRCSDLFRACQDVIRCAIRDRAEFRRPKTNKTTRMDGLLMQRSEVPTRPVNGLDLTENWIKENYPEIHKSIHERLEDQESDLDAFFYELNRMLDNNKVLVRFRKEKEELIRLSESIQESLDEEIDRVK